MTWTEKKHQWAVDLDGKLLGFQGHYGKSGTQLFATRSEARIAMRRVQQRVRYARIVKVQASYSEIGTNRASS